MFLFEPFVLPAFGSFVLSSSYIRTRTIFPVCIVFFCGFVFFLSHTYLPPSLGLTFFSIFIFLMARFQLLRMPVSFHVPRIHKPNNRFKAEYFVLLSSLPLSLF